MVSREALKLNEILRNALHHCGHARIGEGRRGSGALDLPRLTWPAAAGVVVFAIRQHETGVAPRPRASVPAPRWGRIARVVVGSPPGDGGLACGQVTGWSPSDCPAAWTLTGSSSASDVWTIRTSQAAFLATSPGTDPSS